MAARKKSPKLAELASEPNPAAPIDAARFLAAAKPVLKALEADLLARARESAAVTEALKVRHAAQKKAERTAEAFAPWQRQLVEQVAAAWLLTCVFARALEDRGLLERNRIAGPGATDAQKLFFELAPSLTERDYLYAVFRELSHHPAAADLFGPKHNPVWLLAPSAEGAKALLSLFRSPSADAPAFRFGERSTRYLGDLYQDLNENVRERFALLQTPDFVEEFILDRTLDPAIEKFGLDDTELIDPTCGSGHFLLGAFDRFFDRLQRAQPDRPAALLAKAALDKVHGADLNPYAVAIAKFRLTLAFLDKAGLDKLRAAPALDLKLAVADSLLYNPQLEQGSLFHQEGADAAKWERRAFSLEDEDAARAVLHKQYAAVVGNPPYITVKDKALREQYRKLYPSAQREYALTVPFCERFFQLARKGGRVGQITSNSFMKREFGKKLIEDYLPSVNLDLIVNTSGAYIPGHGTPTVLLFGSHEPAQGDEVLTVLAKRGEPSTPADPAAGLVWTSISTHFAEVGYDDAFVSVEYVERSWLRSHPWVLPGGGGIALFRLLEERRSTRLGEVAEAIGFVCLTRADDIYFTPRHALLAAGVRPEHIIENVEGEVVRDWAVSNPNTTLFPYDADLRPTTSSAPVRFLWPFRTMLWLRREPNGNHREIGLTWYEWSRFQRTRYQAPLKITFAFVATHNHFVLDRGGKVFKQSAPIIKLPETATEEDHLALLAYLNSSTACFWMKQVMMNKGATSDKGVLQADEDKFRFEFDGTKMKLVPLPFRYADPELVSLARGLSEACEAVSGQNYLAALENEALEAESLAAEWQTIDARHAELRGHAVALQEEIDWRVYGLFGLCSDVSGLVHGRDEWRGLRADPEERAFLSPEPPELVRQSRRAEIAGNPAIALIEDRMYKRRWYQSQGKFNAEAITDETLRARSLEEFIGGRCEEAFATVEAVSRRDVLSTLGKVADRLRALVQDAEVTAPFERALMTESIPYLAAYRLTEPGLEKRAAWEKTWDLQRREDRGEDVGTIPVPPKYDQKDFRDPSFWRLRGKLDVPKERFISYPGCESDEDGEPLYGWAGWTPEQRAKALATLYYHRKTEEGWDKPRLTPLLAGLRELQLWLDLWHADPADDYGGLTPADYYRGFWTAECQAFGLTPEDVKAWRPPEKAKGRMAAQKKAPSK